MTHRGDTLTSIDSGDDPTSLDLAIASQLWMSPIATILSSAADGLIYDANPAFCELFGYRRDELIGKRSIDLRLWAHEEDRNRLLEALIDGVESASVEVKARIATGEVRDVITSVAIVETDGRQSLVGQIYDITERRRTEDRLRLSAKIAQIGYESTSFNQVLIDSLTVIKETSRSARVGYASVEHGKLTTLAAVGPAGMPLKDLRTLHPTEEPEYLAAFSSGSPVVIEDVTQHVRLPNMLAGLVENGVRAIVDIPVHRGEALAGVLFLDSLEPRSWSDSTVKTLTEAAALLSFSLMRARAEEDLRRERELMQTVMDYVPDFLYMKDATLRFTRINWAMAKFYGFDDPADAIGLTDFDLLPEQLAERYMEEERQIVEAGCPVINVLEPLDEHKTSWVLTSKIPIKDPSGRTLGMVGTARDVTDRQAMESELRSSESRQRAILDAIPDIVMRFNREGIYLDVRSSREGALWVDPSERIGRRLGELGHSRAAEIMLGAIRRSLDTGSVVTIEYEMERDGRIHIFEMRLAPCDTDEVVAISRDVTERKMLEKRLEYQATHDSLTGLPNRSLFIDRLSESLELARLEHAHVGVIFIDLDDFKHVNDTYGHTIGDRLLVAVAERLRQSIPDGDTVCRIAGDEFAVLHLGDASENEMNSIAGRISDYLALPIRLGEQTARISASVGIAIGSPERESPESLLAAADHAMYTAKRIAKGELPFAGAATG